MILVSLMTARALAGQRPEADRRTLRAEFERLFARSLRLRATARRRDAA